MTCQRQGHRAVSTDHNFWRERRAKSGKSNPRRLLTNLTPYRWAKPAHPYMTVNHTHIALNICLQAGLVADKTGLQLCWQKLTYQPTSGGEDSIRFCALWAISRCLSHTRSCVSTISYQITTQFNLRQCGEDILIFPPLWNVQGARK